MHDPGTPLAVLPAPPPRVGETGSRGGGECQLEAKDFAGGDGEDLVEPGAETIRGFRQERADSAGVRGVEGGSKALQGFGGRDETTTSTMIFVGKIQWWGGEQVGRLPCVACLRAWIVTTGWVSVWDHLRNSNMGERSVVLFMAQKMVGYGGAATEC